MIAQRGRHGGCKAAKPGSEISVYDIVQAVDPIRRIHMCPVGIPSHGRTFARSTANLMTRRVSSKRPFDRRRWLIF